MGSGRFRAGLVLAAVLAAVAVAYLPSLDGVFLFDDFDAIRDNVHIRSLWPLSEAMSLPLRHASDTVSGRPLYSLSLALSHAIHGNGPRGYHIDNLLIHLAAVAALFGCVRRTASGAGLAPAVATFLAFAGALAWGLHPLGTSAVTYLAQRAESLAAALVLAALYAFIRSTVGARGTAWQAASVAAAAVAMGVKETAVVTPVLVLLYDATFVASGVAAALRARPRFYLAQASTWCVTAACFALLMGDPNPLHDDFGHRDQLAYLLTQTEVLARYLGLLAWPDPLLMAYDWPVVGGAGDLGVASLVTVALAVAALVGLVRRSPAGFLVFAFFLALAPTSSIVALQQRIMEHRAYLASAGILVAAVLGLHRATAGRSWKERVGGVEVVVVLVLATAAGARTWARNTDYQDLRGFWQANVDHRPDSYTAHLHLGRALLDAGDLEGAERHLRRVVELEPGYATALNSLGILYTGQRRWSEARQQFHAALQARPRYALVWNNLGYLEQQAGDAAAAAHAYAQAVALAPDLTRAWVNRARLAQSVADWDSAAASWARAAELGAEDASASAARAFLHAGQHARALAYFRTATEENPDDAGLWNDLGALYAIGGDPGQALGCLRKAVERAPTTASYQYNLGNLLAETGNVEEARIHLREAVRLAGSYPQAEQRLEQLP